MELCLNLEDCNSYIYLVISTFSMDYLDQKKKKKKKRIGPELETELINVTINSVVHFIDVWNP